MTQKTVKLIRHARDPKTNEIKSPGEFFEIPEAELPKWEKGGFIAKQPKAVAGKKADESTDSKP